MLTIEQLIYEHVLDAQIQLSNLVWGYPGFARPDPHTETKILLQVTIKEIIKAAIIEDKKQFHELLKTQASCLETLEIGHQINWNISYFTFQIFSILQKPLSSLKIQKGEQLIFNYLDSRIDISLKQNVEGEIEQRYESIYPQSRSVYNVEKGCCGSILENGNVDKNAFPSASRIVVLGLYDKGKMTAYLPEGNSTSINFTSFSSLTGPVTLEIWECSCGHQDCINRHRLSALLEASEIDPNITDGQSYIPSKSIRLLSSRLENAVKGLKMIKTGSFQKGMFYPLLARQNNIFL